MSQMKMDHVTGISTRMVSAANSNSYQEYVSDEESSSESSLFDGYQIPSTSTPNQTLMRRHSSDSLFVLPSAPRSRFTVMAVPVFDMRNNRFLVRPHFHKLKPLSSSNAEIKCEVSQSFKVPEHCVKIIEKVGIGEESLVKTNVLILPNEEQGEHLFIMLEHYSHIEKIHPDIFCIQIIKNLTLRHLSDIISQKLDSGGTSCICMRGRKLEEEKSLHELHIPSFSSIQVVQSGTKTMKFCSQPRSGAEFCYTLQDIDVTWTVQTLKEKLLSEYEDLIMAFQPDPELCLHLSVNGKLLKEDQCVGLAIRRDREERFTLHFATQESISVILTYRERRVKYSKQIIISPECSTASLRGTVGCYMNIDPKAVKLVINGVRIDEHDNLKDVYPDILKNGCTVHAGVKKKKCLRIKNPETQVEMKEEMYMLEPVHMLKRKIAAKFGLQILNISLWCREYEMKSNNLLLNYPLKNNMALTLNLYERRLLVHVNIVLKKIRVSVVVDDSRVTTVDDLQRFCAHTYGYNSSSSRSLYKQMCLERDQTLEHVGVVSRETIIIVAFQEVEALKGQIIKVFTVHPDGITTQSYGTVVEGQIFQGAPELEYSQVSETEKPPDNGQVPKGIHLSEQYCKTRRTQRQGSEISTSTGKGQRLTKLERRKLLNKFLPQARQLNRLHKRKKKQGRPQEDTDKELTKVKQAYLSEADISGQAKETDSDHEMKGELTRSSSDLDPDNTEVKQVCALDEKFIDMKKEGDERTKRIARFYISQSGDTCTDGNKSDAATRNELHFSRQEDDIHRGRLERPGQLCTDKDRHCRCCVRWSNPNYENNLNNENQTNANVKIHDTKVLSFNNIEADIKYQRSENVHDEGRADNCICQNANQNNIDLSPSSDISAIQTIRPNVSSASVDKSTETDFSDTEREDRSNAVAVTSVANIPCPYLRSRLPELSGRRTRTTSETEVYLRALPLHPVHSYPELSVWRQYIDVINTSGITTLLLNTVSEKVGKQWKKLMRKLELDETLIDECETKYQTMYESCYQALLLWKQSTGVAGSRQVLLQALEHIGMVNLLEALNGYHTA